MVIHSSKLIYPREIYQRGVERKRVELIARDFNEYIVNEPKVSFRNGRYYVMDGQHTIEGRILRNGGKDLPILCKVYTGMTVEQEALLFAEQNGHAAPLSAGIKLRAKVVGGDAISKAFLAATNRVGLSLNYDSQQLTDYRIGCVGTAFRLYKQMGEPLYCETMRLIVAAWEGKPDSFRASVLKGMMHFVELYHGEFSEERLLRALRNIHPVDIYRIGQDDPAKLRGWKKYVFRAMKIAGIALLAYLFVIFVPKEGQSFGVKWWGILGLIGWSYLGCSLIYLLTHDYLGRNVAVMLLLVACSLLTAAGVFKSVEFVGYIPSQPVLYSLSMAGVLASVIMKKYASTSSPGRFIAVMLAIGIVMFGAGLFAHKYWIISKILATPTWLFYCCAMYFPLFALIYWIADVKGRGGWFDVIKPAGTLTLTCYIIPYITGSLMSIMHVHWPAVTYAGTPGLVRSALYSLAVVWIAWLLSKIHIKLKI